MTSHLQARLGRYIFGLVVLTLVAAVIATRLVIVGSYQVWTCPRPPRDVLRQWSVPPQYRQTFRDSAFKLQDNWKEWLLQPPNPDEESNAKLALEYHINRTVSSLENIPSGEGFSALVEAVRAASNQAHFVQLCADSSSNPKELMLQDSHLSLGCKLGIYFEWYGLPPTVNAIALADKVMIWAEQTYLHIHQAQAVVKELRNAIRRHRVDLSGELSHEIHRIAHNEVFWLSRWELPFDPQERDKRSTANVLPLQRVDSNVLQLIRKEYMELVRLHFFADVLENMLEEHATTVQGIKYEIQEFEESESLYTVRLASQFGRLESARMGILNLLPLRAARTVHEAFAVARAGNTTAFKRSVTKWAGQYMEMGKENVGCREQQALTLWRVFFMESDVKVRIAEQRLQRYFWESPDK